MRLHACVVACRSEKFRVMLEVGMLESSSRVVTIRTKRPDLYRLMIEWIYTGNCEMPHDIFDVIELLKLGDEHFLEDLVSTCEEGVILRLEGENVMRVLTDSSLQIPERVERNIIEEAKLTLLHEFD